MLKHINEKNEFEKEIKEGTVLVDFFATWCGPCKMLSPVLEEVAKENSNVTIIKVDVDEATELSSLFQIQAVPTLILFKDGKKIETKMGYLNKNQINTLLNQ